ncbi:asparagine synthase-related protein [Natrinema sp. 1APR25-10V2]|uniref:asparagine synthase-related protein n=1 Tax=Natrinema sp. 1APR25-10V2 TaxID=2951081 RepID=UPI0028756F55|nr:asparagine synthase-related protein [Natrinema sp. 1APR25-10V2]MDS0475130.1 asparagine synthase-related protein [Natrinema sp. 1APR25-10V2]
MVGVTGRTTSSDDRSFAASLEPLVHTDRYEREVVHESSSCAVGTTAYPEYPVRIVEDEDRWVCLEGRIYDRPDDVLERELLEVATDVLAADGDEAFLTEWLLETDGEFLLVAVDKDSGRLGLLNDPLARLPTYYFHDGETFLFSRELRYLINEAPIEGFDPMGVAQCLLFGYSLGDRTLVQGANRLRPGTKLTVDPDCGAITETALHRFDFGEPTFADRSRSRNASELVDRFERACRRRSGRGSRDVISLSGGLDSRSVLAGYSAEGIPMTAATMASDEFVPPSDVEIARELAGELEVDWQRYEVGPPNGSDLDRIIKTKNGQIGLLTSFILDFFRQLRAEYDASLTYVTGDGGDKVLPDLTPARPLADESELVDYIVEENCFLSLEQVARITGLSAEAIRRSVHDRLCMYPESDPDSKYVHFLVYERGVNFLFEGEDRNRFFFWSTTPFYSSDFFRYAMNCPPDQKARYNLYRSFLSELEPAAAELPHPDYGVPVASTRHEAAAFVDDLLSRYPRVFDAVQPIVKSINGLETDSQLRPDTVDCIRTQVEQCEAVDDVLSTDELHAFLDARADHDRTSVYRLFALTSFIDDVHSSQSVLESRRDTVFG